jgi:DNA-binding phage protein
VYEEKNKITNQSLVEKENLISDPDFFTFLTATRFSEEILSILKERGVKFPKRYLADLLGVSRSSITQFFNNDGNYTLKTMIRIASALGVEVQHRIGI